MGDNNKQLEMAASYKYYKLSEENSQKDAIPQWMDKILDKQPQTAPITDVTGIWP